VSCGAEIEMEKYQIERIVGRGAYGTVYLCKTISEGTFVIIKQIPMDQMSPTDRQVWLKVSKCQKHFFLKLYCPKIDLNF
jgi:NIMA (never in mitosis gene a)-related kinase